MWEWGSFLPVPPHSHSMVGESGSKSSVEHRLPALSWRSRPSEKSSVNSSANFTTRFRDACRRPPASGWHCFGFGVGAPFVASGVKTTWVIFSSVQRRALKERHSASFGELYAVDTDMPVHRAEFTDKRRDLGTYVTTHALATQ